MPPANPQSPIDYLGEEIPPDQLVGPEDFPKNPVEHNEEEPPLAAQLVAQPQDVQAIPEADGPALPAEEDLIQPQVADNFNNNIHVGLALMGSEQADPVWARAKKAEATRLWARFFSPDSEAEDSSKGKELDDAEAAQSSTRKRSAKCSPALVETQVRRSPRLKHNNKDKNEEKQANCKSKNCTCHSR
ncbi:uncharacterized protein [Miscanthus floridulus]|uniref:uncharacterized protein isoform X2 n=1 Tax=Miscanthus floridulus TaxID=154761 RepID=UPI00345A4910